MIWICVAVKKAECEKKWNIDNNVQFQYVLCARFNIPPLRGNIIGENKGTENKQFGTNTELRSHTQKPKNQAEWRIMLPWSSNNKYPCKHATSNDSDLSKIVAVATNKIQSNMTPLASEEASAPPSLRPYEMRKNYQQKTKTSAEIISETRSMLANGKFYSCA